jgi:hypothetical protein
MRIRASNVIAWAAILGSVSCGAASQGGAGVAAPATYKKPLGTAALTDVQAKVPKIFSRYQYEIERQDASPALLTILTRWNGRYPLADEQAQGVTETRTRFILTARARARSGGTADVRIVEFSAENQVLTGGATEWHPLMTTMFREYLDKLVDELKTELLTGIRVY